MTSSSTCASTACFPPSCFTGKERDTESGNDYFGARYYASNMGRFMSPDWAAKAEPVPYAKLGNPQSLNLYAYMLNNPLKGVDRDGHDGDICKQNGADCSGASKVTQNANGTTTVTQGTTTPVQNRDADGKVTRITTRSTITTVTLDSDGKVQSATQNQSVTEQKVDTNGNAVGASKDVSGGYQGATVSQTSPQVTAMQQAGQTWMQQTKVGDAFDMIPGAKLVPGESIFTKILNNLSLNDLLKPDPPSLMNYTCVKAGMNCF
jgi:RHS repeat-associated protein